MWQNWFFKKETKGFKKESSSKPDELMSVGELTLHLLMLAILKNKQIFRKKRTNLKEAVQQKYFLIKVLDICL